MLTCVAAILVFAPSASAAPAPRIVDIQMVPPYAGVHFTLNGVAGVSSAGGVATVPDPNLNQLDLAVPKQPYGYTAQVQLDRVQTDTNHGVFTRRLLAELDVDQLVSIKFLTPKRSLLPVSQVSSVTLNNSLGSTTRYTRVQLERPILLPASRPAKVATGVGSRTVSYGVKAVMIRGANVVNSDQNRFVARDNPTWKIPVILHSLTIDGNDLLAGAPAGSSVRLTYPDQSVQTVAFRAGHRVVLTDLPRGTYKVKVNGGLVPLASTVRLSRDQTATEIVVTAGDAAELAAVVIVVLAILVAAGVIGRRLRRRGAQPESDAAEPDSRPPQPGSEAAEPGAADPDPDSAFHESDSDGPPPEVGADQLEAKGATGAARV